MPEEHNGPRDAALAALGSHEAIRFLAWLGWELTAAARGEYGTQGDMPPGSEYSLRSYNELLHRTSMQMCESVGVPHTVDTPTRPSLSCFKLRPPGRTVSPTWKLLWVVPCGRWQRMVSNRR